MSSTEKSYLRTSRIGFTAIDMLLTIGVIAITAGVSVPMYRNFQVRSDLDLAVDQTMQGLARAQLKSQAGEHDGAWGYQVAGGTVFLGDAYATRDTGYDDTIALPLSVSAYGISEVEFARVNGTPSVTGDIILEAANGLRRTITVSADGTLSTSSALQSDFGENGDTETGGTSGGDNGSTTGDTGGQSSAGDSSDTTSSTGGSTGDGSSGTGGSTTGGTSGGESGSSTGDSDGQSSSGNSSSSAGSECTDRFVVQNDGTIDTTGTVTLTVRALGSAITYGAGGPKVDVRTQVSTDNGETWNQLFGNSPIQGNEQEVLSGLSSGQQILVQVNGRYGWLFNKTYKTNDTTDHLLVLRNGDSLPDVRAFDNQASLTSFLQNIIGDDGKISIGEYDAVVLGELGTLNSDSTDFQDVVLLLSFAQDTGSCAGSSDPKFKITWERLENTGNGNAAKKAYVGQAGWVYGESQWIPLLSENGSVATDAALTEAVEGLAIQRKNGSVRILAHGSLSGGGKEIVDARITFDGAKVTGMSNDEGDNKAESPFDGVVNDGSGGDEATVANGSDSVLFQTRVTGSDDAIFIQWMQASSSDAENSSSSSSSSSVSSAGSTGDTGGSSSATTSSTDDDTDKCAAAYSEENGKLVLQEDADVSFRVLGSESRYNGSNGPEIEVRLNLSTDGGSTWRSLFGYGRVSGGETDAVLNIPAGSTIVLQAEGRRGWLFKRDTTAGDGSNRIRILRRGQSDPGTTIFKTPEKLKPFLRSHLEKNKAIIRPKEALVLVELQNLDGTADYQDVVILMTVEKPASRGICGAREDDENKDEQSSSSSLNQQSSSTTSSAETSASSVTSSSSELNSEGGTSSSSSESSAATVADITICHFPPGNPRNTQTITVSGSAWAAHAEHGDRRGPCEGDGDGDGILNSDDLCADTFVPEPVPTEGNMLFNRYAVTSNSFVFSEGPRKKISEFTLADTKGCSCGQLVDVAEGNKVYRFEQFPRLLRELKSLFPFYTEGARQNGCGKAMLQAVKRHGNE